MATFIAPALAPPKILFSTQLQRPSPTQPPLFLFHPRSYIDRTEGLYFMPRLANTNNLTAIDLLKLINLSRRTDISFSVSLAGLRSSSCRAKTLTEYIADIEQVSTDRKSSDCQKKHEFLKLGVTIRHWILCPVTLVLPPFSILSLAR